MDTYNNDELIENDRLVLYMEEICEFSGKDMHCYILFDEVEQEYFITGSRRKNKNESYGNFKFYCKSKQSLIYYLSFIMDSEDCTINYGLFNYVNLFDSQNYITFNSLENSRISCSELAFYTEMPFNSYSIRQLLTTLQQVRY